MAVNFILTVVGDEFLADDLAWVCEKTFGCRPVFHPRTGPPPTWSFSVRPDEEGGVTDLPPPAAPVSELEHPLERELRLRFDRLIRSAGSILSVRPGLDIRIGFPGQAPLSLSGANSELLLDLLWASPPPDAPPA